jgi:hypothetical protein
MVAHLVTNFATACTLGLGLLSVERFFAIVPLLLLLFAVILVAYFGPNRLGQPRDKVAGPPLRGRGLSLP